MGLGDWIKRRREATENYIPHPLDRGLQLITLGALFPHLGLVRYPVVGNYNAWEYDPISAFVFPIAIFALAVLYRLKEKTWSYWVLWVLAMIQLLGELTHLVAMYLGWYEETIIADNYVAAVCTMVGAIVVVVGCWRYRGVRKSLKPRGNQL